MTCAFYAALSCTINSFQILPSLTKWWHGQGVAILGISFEAGWSCNILRQLISSDRSLVPIEVRIKAFLSSQKLSWYILSTLFRIRRDRHSKTWRWVYLSILGQLKRSSSVVWSPAMLRNAPPTIYLPSSFLCSFLISSINIVGRLFPLE